MLRQRHVAWIAGLSCLLLPQAIAAGADKATDRPVEFNRDIRPILSNNCFVCHGPDNNLRKAKLRLEVEKEAKADRGGYHAIVAGQPENSELFQRIVAKHEKDRMPPAKSGKSLSKHEIEVLQRWIKEGAKWQEHWSLIPPS